jgi:hypothetical protein
VNIDPAWVLKFVAPSDAPEANRWAADPAHAAELRPTFRHVLVKVDSDAPGSSAAARRRIDAVLARLKRGEDFAAVAKETSEDPGSAGTGGAYTGEQTLQFVDSVRLAYERLQPGELSEPPIQSTFGWHVIRKDSVDGATRLAAHRRWTARNKAEALARDLLPRLRGAGADAPGRAVEAAVLAVLGEAAAHDPHLPKIDRIAADAPASALGETCKGLSKTAREAGIEARDDGSFVVATLTDRPADASERDEERCVVAGQLSPADVRRMIEGVQRDMATKATSAPPDTKRIQAQPQMPGWIATATRRARLFEVYRVDDAVNALGAVPDASLPKGAEILFTYVPNGTTQPSVKSYFARFEVLPNEAEDATLHRARGWLATMLHPPGTFFVLQPSWDEAGGRGRRYYETVLARDPVIVDERDAARATLETRDVEFPSVRVELRPDAAKRFQEATAEWTQRRVVLLVDGTAVDAPIVMSPITGWICSLTAPGRTTAERRANAERLARAMTH